MVAIPGANTPLVIVPAALVCTVIFAVEAARLTMVTDKQGALLLGAEPFAGSLTVVALVQVYTLTPPSAAVNVTVVPVLNVAD